MLEGNRFWFYSLVLSIIWGCVQISRLPSGDEGTSEKERGEKTRGPNSKSNAERDKEVEKLQIATAENQRRLRRRLVADVFDLFIPGHVTGWLPTNLAIVGFATTVSTLLSSKDIWDRLQEES
jgi:hypothetical protein